MKEYTVVINCNLIDTIVNDDDVENIIRSELYKQQMKWLIKDNTKVDDVDITDVKVFVRDLDSEESEG